MACRKGNNIPFPTNYSMETNVTLDENNLKQKKKMNFCQKFIFLFERGEISKPFRQTSKRFISSRRVLEHCEMFMSNFLLKITCLIINVQFFISEKQFY